MVRERSRVILDGHAAVHTNTFFGRFPASYWQRWTSVRSVEFGAVVSGSGRLRIMASDAEGDPRTVATHHVADGHQAVQLTLPIDKFVDGGAMSLELETTTAGMTVEEVRWSVGRTRARRATAVVGARTTAPTTAWPPCRPWSPTRRSSASWPRSTSSTRAPTRSTPARPSPRCATRSGRRCATSGSRTSAAPGASPAASTRPSATRRSTASTCC